MERLELVGLLSVLFFAVVLTSLPFQVALYRHLEKHWPEVFVAAGRPRLLHANGQKFVSPDFYRFLIYRKHRTLGDKRLSSLSDVNLAFLAVAGLLFVVLFLLVVVGKRL